MIDFHNLLIIAWLVFGFISGLARVYQLWKVSPPSLNQRPFYICLLLSLSFMGAVFGLCAPLFLVLITRSSED